MFVKKFEAPSLEQALKMIKTEMGPEALILSTQEKRNGKLFSRRTIEVTAAAEKKKNDPNISGKRGKNRSYEDSDSQELPKRNKEMESYKAVAQQGGNTNKNAKAERYIEIDSDKVARSQTYVPKERPDFSKFEMGFRHLGVSPERSLELSKKMAAEFSKSELGNASILGKAKAKLLSQGIRTLTTEEFFKRRSWVSVGVAGSGKTTLLVKLAILSRSFEKSVSLISMDSRKFLGRGEMAGYARLIKVPFFTEINQASHEKMKLIDSPALNLGEGGNTALEKLCVERSVMLVLDASTRYSELMRQIDHAMVFNPEAIVFTKTDNVEERGVIYDVLKATQLPLVGLSVSASFKTKFRFLTPADLAMYLVKE